MGSLSKYFDVLFFLLRFHMVVDLTKFVHKDHHVFVLSDFLHHEPAHLFIADRHGMLLLEFRQDLKQLPLKVN